MVAAIYLLVIVVSPMLLLFLLLERTCSEITSLSLNQSSLGKVIVFFWMSKGLSVGEKWQAAMKSKSQSADYFVNIFVFFYSFADRLI